MSDELREQIAHDLAPSVWPILLERHKERLRRKADAILSLPALHALATERDALLVCSGCGMPGGRHWDTCPNRGDGRPTR